MHGSELVRRNRWWLVSVLTAVFLLGCKDATEPQDEQQPVATIVVAPKAGVWTGVLKVGQTIVLQAKAEAADGTELPVAGFTWTSSDTLVASVNAAGEVVARKPGSAAITAAASGKQGGTNLLVVVDPANQVAFVKVLPIAVVLPVGQTRQFAAHAFGADSSEIFGLPVAWSTDTPDLISVNASGLVTGLQHGYATVFATVGGKIAASAITVTDAAGDGDRAAAVAAQTRTIVTIESPTRLLRPLTAR